MMQSYTLPPIDQERLAAKIVDMMDLRRQLDNTGVYSQHMHLAMDLVRSYTIPN